jgi:5-methylcytosine-specific restriction endonuclease McrA
MAFKIGNIPWSKTHQYSEASRIKISNSHKGKHPRTEFKKGDKGHLGYKHSEETKELMRLARVGKSSCMKGKHHTEETKEKMRIKKLGIPLTDEHKRNIGDAHKGEKNINWKGGSSFEPYGLEFNRQLKEMIRQRNNFTCQRCGAKENGKKLAVHHIDFNKKNNGIENLVSLCNSCHSFITTNKVIMNV